MFPRTGDIVAAEAYLAEPSGIGCCLIGAELQSGTLGRLDLALADVEGGV